MKRNILPVLVLAVSLLGLGACSRGYESEKSTGGMNITLKADSYPLMKGDNKMNVKVSDASGTAVKNAKVDVRFYMPPMPGMAPMESRTQAMLHGDKYVFTVNAAMEGGWKTEVTVTQPGKPAVTSTFNVDAR